jgi:hypothetical protein
LRLYGVVVAFLSVIPEGDLLLLFVKAEEQKQERQQIPFGDDRKKRNSFKRDLRF